MRVQPGMLVPQLGCWGRVPAFSGQGPHALPQPDPQLSSLCLGGFLSHQTMCELKSAPSFGLRPGAGHMRSISGCGREAGARVGDGGAGLKGG